ncbi:NAD(P)-dependent oxidoreductase [Desulfallas sp. Bu1-1]|uniref:NAD(P)-dependent oxidoreductase n=1 Tax=Desulfallas sp. Bu1-1 TaxID=2787620 RepID=UPI0018A08D2A|nr:NAD(P)-dependent oxidoreductase [Desulfallas sp. Bu1-1]MBF7082972.1 NAD(P)-dependent oxidoreductase [Desulfallas sp. Bu1-1]
MERIGFIGLGVMGNLMCRRVLLLKNPVSVYDVDKKAVARMVEAGAEARKSPAEVAEYSDIVLASLPDDSVIEKVIFGENGLLEGIKPGNVFVDLSSSTPVMTKKVGQALLAKGAEMLDAPVSRGAPAAKEGTLSIMVGGKMEVMERCRFILEQLGTDIIHVGELGAAHTLKSLNNLLSATNLITSLEGTIIAAKAGVDPFKFIEAVNAGSGRSHMTTVRYPKYYLARKFESNFSLRLMYKDCSIALDLAKQLGTPMLFSSITQHIYAMAISQGMGGEDNTKIMLLLEKLMNYSMGVGGN